MAHPISFKPQAIDPHQELQRDLGSAPRKHAEALLVAYDLLQTAHDQGVLDLLQGVIGGRDIIAGKLGEGMAMPETVSAVRNLIALGRILASVDPDLLHRIARSMSEAAAPTLERERDATLPRTATHASSQPLPKQPAREAEPPSLWQLFKRVSSRDGRRGLAFAVNMLTATGRALRPASGTK